MKARLNIRSSHPPRRLRRKVLNILAGGITFVVAPLTALAQTTAPPSGGQQAAPSAAPSVLPGGAQAINEAFQDWMVQCVSSDGGKRCSISQQQADANIRQRLLAIELQPKGEKADGVLVLPFGILIDKGVTFKVGDTSLGSLRFKTCLPQGCLVPFSFDAKSLALLRAENAPLSIGAQNDAKQPLAFSVSVKGFGQALDRATSLGK